MPQRKRRDGLRKSRLVFTSSPIHIARHPPSPVFSVDNPIHADIVPVGSQLDITWVTSHFADQSQVIKSRSGHNHSVRRCLRNRYEPLDLTEGDAPVTRSATSFNGRRSNYSRRRSARLNVTPNRGNRSVDLSALGECTISECDSDVADERSFHRIGNGKYRQRPKRVYKDKSGSVTGEGGCRDGSVGCGVDVVGEGGWRDGSVGCGVDVVGGGGYRERCVGHEVGVVGKGGCREGRVGHEVGVVGKGGCREGRVGHEVGVVGEGGCREGRIGCGVGVVGERGCREGRVGCGVGVVGEGGCREGRVGCGVGVVGEVDESYEYCRDLGQISTPDVSRLKDKEMPRGQRLGHCGNRDMKLPEQTGAPNDCTLMGPKISRRTQETGHVTNGDTVNCEVNEDIHADDECSVRKRYLIKSSHCEDVIICRQCQKPVKCTENSSRINDPNEKGLFLCKDCINCKENLNGMFHSSFLLTDHSGNDEILAPDTPECDYGKTRRMKWMEKVRLRERQKRHALVDGSRP